MHTGSGVFNLRDAEMIAAKHDVRVLHLIRPDWFLETEESRSDLDVRRVPFSITEPRTWARARRAIRDELAGAELLHTMAFPALVPFSGVRVRVPWLHTEHWSGLTKPLGGLKAMLKRLLFRRLRRPDVVVAVSESLADTIRPWCRSVPLIIENAVPMPERGCMSEPFTSGASLRLISVGGLVAHKGPIAAVQATAELVRRGFDAHLRWVGQGADRAEVEAAIVETGLSARVQLVGQVDRTELEHHLLSSHVFMLPTAGETFGIALAEALACGLPVVTSGTGGHTFMIKDFDAAKVAHRNPSDLADAVEELLAQDNADLRRATTLRARERFSENRRIEAYAAAYEATFAGMSSRQRTNHSWR